MAHSATATRSTDTLDTLDLRESAAAPDTDGSATDVASATAPTTRHWSTGRSLFELVRQAEELPADLVARIGAGAAQELERLHRSGQVHGDLRSDTIIVCPDGRVWLVDPATSARILPASIPERRAPEVSRGERPTPATDVYQLGLVLLEALRGGADDRVSGADAPHRELRAPTMPAGLTPAWVQILMGMVADNPAARLRPSTVEERLIALTTSNTHEPQPADTDAAGHAVPMRAAERPSGEPKGPTPRQLGTAVLTTVTVLFGLLLTFGSPEPSEVPMPTGPIAAVDGAGDETGSGPELTP